MINIKALQVKIADKTIIDGLDLTIQKGELHAIMGLNGSGKSTLSKAIVGHYDTTVTEGDIIYNGRSILEMAPEERALEGIFLSYQNPIEIPGVNNAYFLRTAVNAKREHEGKIPYNPAEFLKLMRQKIDQLGMKQEILHRSLNEGFSGGEKKRNEILQMEMLEPELIILDEIDSGLDIDALKSVAEGINRMKNGKRSFLVITHYSRILDYLDPDYVHVLQDGKIVKTGGPELVKTLELEGYKAIAEVTS